VKSLPASTLAMLKGERIQKFSLTLAGDVPVAAQRVPLVVVTIKSVVSFVSFIFITNSIPEKNGKGEINLFTHNSQNKLAL
jgi:hypothetical protein